MAISRRAFLNVAAALGLLLALLSASHASNTGTSHHQHRSSKQLHATDSEITHGGVATHLVEVILKPPGARVRLRCAIKSSKVYWSKDGHAVPCDVGGCRATLRLSNVTRKHAGMYQCWRPGGRLVPPSIRLKVSGRHGGGRPRLMGPWPSNTSVVAGSPASLRCRVYSAIPPNIQWLRRLEQLDLVLPTNKTIQYEGDTYEVLISSGEAALANHSYLTKLLVAHTSEEDSGFYVCLATNNHGFRFRGAHLTVLPRSSAGVLPGGGLLHVEVALLVLVVVLVAAPVLALTYLAYSHRRALIARKTPPLSSAPAAL